MTELVIGLDIGTGSSKGILAQTDGTVLETQIVRHETSFPKPGYAEHDADSVWWNDVIQIIRALTSKAKGEVRAVTLSGIGPVVQPADENGLPLRPAILYGVDTRSSAEIEEMTEKYGRAQILEWTGNDLTSQSAGPKVLWVKKNEPEIWAKTKKLFMAHTYCVYHLTGAYVLDHMAASLCDPFYSPFTTDWIPEVANDVAPDLELPELKWSNEIAGYITESASRLTGLKPGTPVAVGTIDAFAEALSVGVRNYGEVMLMYGSTMVAVQISEKPLVSPNLWSCSGLLKGTYNLSGGMSTTGSLTTWVKDLVGSDYDTLTKEAADVPPGSNGLITLPYFSGERSPIADPFARGLICGLNLTHTRKEIYRSVLEATGYGSRHLLDEVKNSGGNATRYVAVGGGTAGDVWPQIMSDIIGITQLIPKVTVGASYGDALLAAMAIGEAQEDTVWNTIEREITPNPEAHEAYNELYQIYRDLYPQTAESMHKLAKMQI